MSLSFRSAPRGPVRMIGECSPRRTDAQSDTQPAAMTWAAGQRADRCFGPWACPLGTSNLLSAAGCRGG